MFDGEILNVKFPYSYHLKNGIMQEINPEVHPCLVLKKENVNNKEYAIVSLGTSKFHKSEQKEFKTEDNKHQDYGLRLPTRWIINARNIVRIELNSETVTKSIGHLKGPLKKEIDIYIKKKHIKAIIEYLELTDTNKLEDDVVNEDIFWE